MRLETFCILRSTKGEQSGTDLLGKIVESPIVLDYIKETHHVDQKGIPLALLLGTDWEDFYVGSRGRQDYFDFLVKQHPNPNRQELDDLKPGPARPDILMRNGPVYSLAGARFSMSRNEYYENQVGFAGRPKRMGLAGEGLDANISAAAAASLIATWFDYARKAASISF